MPDWAWWAILAIVGVFCLMLFCILVGLVLSFFACIMELPRLMSAARFYFTERGMESHVRRTGSATAPDEDEGGEDSFMDSASL